MRHTIALIFLLLAAGAVGVIVGRSVARPIPPPPREKLERDAGLARVVDSVDFQAVSLEEAFRSLSTKTSANITVRWHELESAGLERTAPLSLRVSNLPLKRVVELICEVVGDGAVLLDARESGGAIVVSTADDAARYSEMRIYDVRDLIKENYDYRVNLGWRPATQPAGGGGGGGGQFLFGNYQLNPDEAVAQDLVRMITEFIDPDMWRDNGGTVGSIREFGGRVLVTATPDMHDQIADLLRLLREGK